MLLTKSHEATLSGLYVAASGNHGLETCKGRSLQPA